MAHADWPKQLLSSALADPGLQGPLKTFWAAGRQRHQSVLDTAFLLSPPPSFLRSLGSPASLWPLLALILLEKGPSALLYERHLSLGPQGYTLLPGLPRATLGNILGVPLTEGTRGDAAEGGAAQLERCHPCVRGPAWEDGKLEATVEMVLVALNVTSPTFDKNG